MTETVNRDDRDPLSDDVPTARRYVWLIGVGLYVLAVWWFGCRRIGDALALLDLRFLAAMMATEAATEWTRALKWRIALGRASNAVGLFFLSKAGGAWSPGRVGELSPLLLPQHRTPKVAAWILTDRILETSATLALGLAGAVSIQATRRGALVLVIAAAFLVVALCAYVLTRRRWFAWLMSRTRDGFLLHRMAGILVKLSDEIIRLRAIVLLAAALTVLTTCMDVVGSVLLCRGFGYEVGFALMATVQCVHALAAAIPFTPNATGVPYLAAMVLLNQVGGVPYPVLTTMVAIQLAALNVVFWTSFGIGAADLRRRRAA